MAATAQKRILVTGGTGYIGSHVAIELAAAGFLPVLLDNYSNSSPDSLRHIRQLIGDARFYQTDYQNSTELNRILDHEPIHGIIHIAAFKAVGESVEQPLRYYENNVAGFVPLLQVILDHNIQTVVFSSSAAVYGNPPTQIVTEETPCAPTSPYGWSKYMDELILRDVCAATPSFNGIALRYFNVVGSHDSGSIGESPRTKPQNLLPIIVRAVSTGTPLTVFGTDYPTPDGTCQRDYIHVVDLAKAHIAALKASFANKLHGYQVFNIGTGRPTSVLELLTAFERVNGIHVPHVLGKRRAGDPVAAYASAERAEQYLAWRASKTIDDAVRSAWDWHQKTVTP